MKRLLLLVLATSGVVVAGFKCSEPWEDYCPPSGASQGTSGCVPYAPALPAAVDYASVRRELAAAALGLGGALPTGAPDLVESVAGNTSVGCWCATIGACDAASCTWPSGMTALTFVTSLPVNATFGNLTVSTRVFLTLNTSGVAPVMYGPVGPPEWPEDPVAPARGRMLVLFHDGHDAPCTLCAPDFDGVVDTLNQLGFDVARIGMPGIGCSNVSSTAHGAAGYTCSMGHGYFEQFAAQGVPVLRFFLDPALRTVNYALTTLGYERVAMVGLSGGGWTTTFAAALEPRIGLSIPVAGSLPCDFHHTSWDFEQFLLCAPTGTPAVPGGVGQVANYTALYALAALEPGRASLQVLHEADPCCFHGCGRHDRIRAYNADIRARLAARAGGAFATLVSRGNAHEVNYRDRAVIASLLDKYMLFGAVNQTDLDNAPFNTLREW